VNISAFASFLGFSNTISIIILSLLNLSSVFGQIILGKLSDRLAPYNVTLISSIGATLSVFLLWGFSSSLPPLILFALVYGFFGGGYASSWTGSINHIVQENPTKKGFVFGLLCAGRGIGNVISGPLSAVLIQAGSRGEKHGGFAYGTIYGNLIVFTGVTAAFGALGWIALGPPRKMLQALKRT